MNSTGGAGTSNYVYIQSEEHAWIPARLDRLIEEGSVNESSKTTTPTKSFFKRGKSASSKKNSGPSAEVTFVSRWDDEDTIASGSKGMAGGSLTTQIISLSEYTNQTLPLQNVDGETGELIEVEDMVNLSYLHEPAILYNLKARHQGGKPYTRTGDIVIAVNPYQWMMDLYSEDMRRLYASKLVFGSHNDNSAEGHDIRSTVAPHVYETSSLAYRGLAYDQQDQSVLVSGESGAGKTETVKILMNHLASVQNAADLFDIDKSIANATSGFKNKSDIVQRVLDSNPLLEAFGNAKTIRNDNSSRFGKYLQLQFDAEDPSHAAYAGRSMPRCVLAGSKCEVYLLEKSRVVSHNVDNERAYHIYYQLLAAPTEDKELIWKDGLLGEDGDEERNNEDYTYVGYTDTFMIEGKSDGERYELTKRALGLIGVEGEIFLSLMRSICIVLQLGNVSLVDDPEDDERSVIEEEDELKLLSDLMGVPSDTITKALTERTVRARNEHFMVPLKADKAMDSRDALAKEIYAKTFLWLVRKINDATCAEWNYDSRSSGQKSNKNQQQKFGLIGLLDIFGFESFDVNRFEQLCINYANEKLQQKFTQDIFRSVQAEYEFEGIPLEKIAYQDNADVLKLVEGRMGLIAILNEECVRPKGADLSFVRKVVSMCSNKQNSTKTIGTTTTTESALWMEKRFQGCQFGIKHYAAKVLYDAEGFVQKNMDNLPPDLLECAKQSSNPIVANELENDAMMNTTKSKSSKSSSKDKAPSKLSRGGSASSSKSTRLVQSTVWSKFRTQLNSLMSLLGETRTRYIRCIKPNPYKQPYNMDQVSTMEQLRCAGVVAAVTISRSAFPNRLEHHAVLERFLLLKQTRKQHFVTSGTTTMTKKKGGNVEDQVYQLLSSVLKSLEAISPHTNKLEQAFVIGRTRTYFRAGALEYLEGERLKGLLNQAIAIQKFVRKHLAMVKYRILRNATIYVQTHIRRHLVAQRYRQMKMAIIKIQSCVRMLFAKRTLMILRWYYGATQLQKLYRGQTARRVFQQKRLSIIIIQAMIRGALQRPKYQRDLAEKKEEAKMENQLLALQRRLEEAEQRRIEAEKRAEEEKELLRKQKEEQEKLAALQPKEKIIYRDRVPASQDDDDDDDTMHTADDDNDSMHTAEAEEEEEEKVDKQQQKKTKKKKSSSSRRQKQQQQQQDIIPTATAVAADDTTHGDTLTTTTNNKPGGTAIVNNIHHHHLTEQQQRLMDESGKMLEHLRKEVFKLRNQNAQLRTDFDLLKDNNQRLMDANANAGASFGALNQHAKQLNKRNTKLTSEVHHLKSLLQKQNMVHVELKEELKMKQNTYITEVQSRLTCEKAISTIVDMITTRCRDQRLVEDILQISDDTEEILNMAREGGGTATGGGAAEPRNNNGGNDTPRSTGGMMSRFTSIFY